MRYLLFVVVAVATAVAFANAVAVVVAVAQEFAEQFVFVVADALKVCVFELLAFVHNAMNELARSYNVRRQIRVGAFNLLVAYLRET